MFSDFVNKGNSTVLTFLFENHGAASEGGFPAVIDARLVGASATNGGIATQGGVTAKAGLGTITGQGRHRQERAAALRRPHGGWPSQDMISCVIVS